ncbi:hypothetical protein FXO38_09519 [Capsicum annuum]|nr:hypothetical protein FXO38_09519 [Capsicum annuum]
MVRDRFQVVENSNLRLRLIGKRGFDGRRYNSPSVSEVVALVVGDFEPPTMLDRDIIIESQSGQLKRINELNASYLGLQYPLLFPYGEDGYREDITLNLNDESSGGRKCVSCREYFSYKIQERKHEDSTIDAMAICKWAKYPDLFITFTCNPKWPEVTRFGKCRGLSPEDRPDILTRIFKIKLDQLLKDLRDNNVFAESPDNLVDPQYYAVVTNLIIHGPCGTARKSSPCMQNGKCTKYFPKKFVDSTTIDDEGYPIYRRRDDGRSTKRAGIDLDNSENTDDSRVVDEINMYCDCRYVSSCEPAWRIFKFPIHHREPSVERLSFHLDGNQNVISSDDDPIDAVVNRPTVKESMFLKWFEANTKFPKARELTYAEFPLKFVWNQQLKKWKKRQTSAFSIGRIFFVPPGSGEQYYLRLLLNVIKGPTSYENLRKINGHC